MNTRQQEIKETKEWYVKYFEDFEKRLNGQQQEPFHRVRRAAISQFAELGFPDRKNEEWKYTRVTPILKHKFQFTDGVGKVSRNQVQQFAFPGLEDRILVYINGVFSSAFSTFTPEIEGVFAGGLKDALEKNEPTVLRHLAKYADFQQQAFTALNTAFALDGAYLYIPDDISVEKPVHLLYLSIPALAPSLNSPRNLIVAGKNSRIHLIESYHSLDDTAVYLNNVVTEMVLAQDAEVEHVRIQKESLRGYHISTLQVEQTARSVYTNINIDLGGALVRKNTNVVLDDERCETHLFGFYMGTDKQHIDNHTLIDHAKPNCESNETYRGILGGKATGVFNGKVFVRPDAQKTNAYQSNKALLLSDDATVNSKPELEIYADDVKCSHGATVGQLDEDALFYLRSRGIPEEKAYSILQQAFASDIFEKIAIETVKEQLENELAERFQQI